MTSSYKYNQNKNKSKEKYNRTKQIIRKSNLNKKSLYYFSNNSKNYEFIKHCFFEIEKEKNLLIEWKEGKNEKYLNGTTNKFDKLYIIKNFGKNHYYFKFYLNLNKSFHKLKFKVKGKIKINSIYIVNQLNSVKTSQENAQNEVTQKRDYLLNDKFRNINDNKEPSISTKDSTVLYSQEKEIKNDNKIIDFNFLLNNYCNYVPKKSDMRENAEKIPSYFPKECFHGINYKHNGIGNKEFLNLKDNNIFCKNNDSYKNIERKDHIVLNHLCIKNINNKLINSFIIKYRHKNTTFLYYK